jgi:hypothetical protein
LCIVWMLCEGDSFWVQANPCLPWCSLST